MRWKLLRQRTERELEGGVPLWNGCALDDSRVGGRQTAAGAESICEGNRAFTLGLLAACRSAWLPEVNLPSSLSARLTAASQNTAAGFGQFLLQNAKNSFISQRRLTVSPSAILLLQACVLKLLRTTYTCLVSLCASSVFLHCPPSLKEHC